jgi:hypothetical protein
MSSNVQQFMDLFDGLRRAYGTFEAKSSRERDGKKTGRVISHLKEVTSDIWVQHLKGVQSIGITPIRDDSTCVFGAIDIDSYDGLDLAKMAVKIDQMRLPLVPCRSKSGGLHAWIFLSEPVPAEIVQRKLREMAAALGFGRSEIFPKQTEVLPDRGDIGSWINMPYFGGLSGGRYGVRPDGSPMPEEEFLSTAAIKRITLSELEGTSIRVKEELADGPPCLQHLVAQGFPAGTRNSGLYNLGVYCKKSSPDNWEQLTEQYNIKVMQPPLGTNEVKELLKSLKKKDYQYTCQQPPISSYCNSNVCRGKKYGIGDHAGMPTVTGLTKYSSVPPIWFADIEGGGRLELTTDDLQSQHRFQRCCMEALNSMPPPMNAKAWQVMIQNLLENVEVIDAPSDATPRGQLLEMIEKFCTQRAQALVKDEIRLGKPFTEGGRHFFTVAALTAFLERHKFKDFKLNEVTSYLKNDLRANHHFSNFRGRGINYWSITEFGKQDDLAVPDGFKNGGPF